MNRYYAYKFLQCDSVKEVASILEVSTSFMSCLSLKANEYNIFKIKKKSGGSREIEAPNKELKKIQTRLAEILKQIYIIQAHDRCFGYVGLRDRVNKGIVANAKCHVGQKYLLNMDIKNFYPSIKKATIANVFKIKPFDFSDSVVLFLTEITCLDYLPTGAPTSPVLSNIVCWWLDEELNNLAKTNNLVYSRYVDDLTFSGDKIDKELISTSVTAVLKKFNLEVNRQKTRLHSQTSRQMVTGITVNEKPNINRKYIRKVRAELHQLNLFPEKVNEKKIERLRGKINFIGEVRGRKDGVYLKQIKNFHLALEYIR
tara:strand:+ start:5152 stop:6093 length:942 start_codon:yes stop_codon:yes gene_type:complete